MCKHVSRRTVLLKLFLLEWASWQPSRSRLRPITAESDLLGTLQSEYVFFNGQRVARRDLPSGNIAYYFSDHLNTASVITDASGNIKSESDYYPWGGELQFVNGDSNHYKFTGKERDSETGLDYFGARYLSSAMGRWTSPDNPFADQHLRTPQSWNLYMYVGDRPTSLIDTNGREVKTEATGQDYQQLVSAIAKAYLRKDFQNNFDARKASPMTFNINKGNTVDKEGAAGDASIKASKDANGKVDPSRSQVDIKLDLDNPATIQTITVRHEFEHAEQADNDPDLFNKTEFGKTPADIAQRKDYEDQARDFANQY